MRRISIFVLAFLALLLASCSPKESGVLRFKTPTVGDVVRIDFQGVPNAYAIPLVISSTYQTDKNVHIYVTSPQGSLGPLNCLVKANAVNQQCSGLPLTVPGRYNLTAVVDRFDGTSDSYEVAFSWKPYTELDRDISAFGGSRAWLGYLVTYLLLMFVISVLVFVFKRDWVWVVSSMAIFTVIMIPVSIFLPSSGVAYSMSCYLVPLAVMLGSISVNLIRNPRPNLVIIRSDGTGVSYGSRKYVKTKRRMMIHEKDINRNLLVQDSGVDKLGSEEE